MSDLDPEFAAGVVSVITQADSYGMTAPEFIDCLTGRAKIRAACASAAARHLSGERAGLLARCDQAAAAVIDATAAMGPAQTTVDTLTARLDQCRELLAEARHAADAEDGDLAELASAGGRADVLARQEGKIAARLAEAQRELSPHTVALAQARAVHRDAERELQTLDHAIADPLNSAEGLGTLPGAYYAIASGAWFEHLDKREARSPLGSQARAALRTALAMSGMGEDIERNALAAERAEADRLRGVTGTPAMQVVSAPGADPAKLPPLPSFQYGPESARIEQAQMRDAAGFTHDPAGGLPVHPVAPMGGEPA